MSHLSRVMLAALCLGTGLPLLAQVTPGERPAVLANPDLSIEARAGDIVARLTLEEKASQLGADAPAIPRLGIPAYNWWNEGLHGVARAGNATVFPQAIGMAATWDPALIERMGDLVADEFRAKYKATLQADGSTAQYRGLTVWSPNINIFRDPRWGRGQETYGEDPLLTSRIAIGYIHGLQGHDPDRIKVSATAKHYAVHSGPEFGRHKVKVTPTPHALEDTYLPAFRAAVIEGKVESVMCAYNAVNGAPACASEFLLAERLRRDWGFRGHVVTDCGAAANIYRDDSLGYTKTAEAGVAAGFKAGMDVICGDYRNDMTTEPKPIVAAVQSGQLPEAVIDVALRRLFATRIRMGLFDPPGRAPFRDIKPDAAPDDPRLARLVADKSMVLLKNNGLLPLKAAPRRIAVVGPTADSQDALVGNYNGVPAKPVTILDGVRKRWPKAEVVYAQGTGLVGAPSDPVPASALCQDAACMRPGLTAKVSGTGGVDRIDTQASVRWQADQRDATTEWTGYLRAPESGEYRFAYSGTRGHDMWVDGKQVLHDAAGNDTHVEANVVRLAGGRTYPIRLTATQRGRSGEQHLSWTLPHMNGDDAVAAARGADLVIFAGGLSARVEGEEMRVDAEGFFGGDRTAIDLPKPQQQLLEKVVAAGKPVVLVLTNGSALSVNWADRNVGAILEAWYPGEEGGSAVAGVIAGDVNPAGRLPVTFYRSLDGLPGFEDYSMAGRTYRYHKGEVLYPFGHGLSFTRFAYGGVVANQPVVDADGAVTISTTVRNTGPRDGDEVVQLYLSRPGLAGAPIRQLAGFQRLTLKKGETRTVRFTLSGRALSTVDPAGVRKIVPGPVEVWVGGGQPIARAGLAMPAGARTRFAIRGEMALPK